MAILDRANAFIGHEQEVDEGYETTMRRRAFIAGFKEALGLVRGMREAQKQWKDGDPFDGTEMELAKRMCESEKEVDEYLKKMEECNGVESKLSSLAKPCPNFTPKKK